MSSLTKMIVLAVHLRKIPSQLFDIQATIKSQLKDVTAFVDEADRMELLREGLDLHSDPKTSDFRPRSSINNDKARSVRVSTIDNFQGEEADVVILSLVRSNKYGQIGFLKVRDALMKSNLI
jgi:superfamily I DNA and/or RNA helicase